MPGNIYRFLVHREDLDSEHIANIHSGPVKGKCRLDIFLLAQECLPCTRSQIRKLIVEGHVTVNEQLTKPGYSIKESDEIVVTFPELRPLTLAPEAIALNILYEDEQLIVLNKPPGMVVHPAPGHNEGTLVHALLHHCQTLSGIGGVQRPGIIHRLDRDTSGVMLVAKTDHAHTSLSDQLKSRQLTRTYSSLVHGRFNALSGRIEAPIGRHPTDRKRMAVRLETGRYALTLYWVLRQYPEHAFLKLELKTGRTHQIRVHLKHIHHPVVGDLMYGNSSKNNLDIRRQALHAQSITFFHPITKEQMTFETPLPEDMQSVLKKLEVLHI